jgi:L-cysteine S-thiosulfotransferase
MKIGLFVLILLGVAARVSADPEADRVAFVKYFKQKFPGVEIAALIDGAYALDEAKREQWLEMEDFPPYEIAVDEGEHLFSVPFANGRSYADCFADGGVGIKQNYPYFDLDRGEVITLELAINDCRLSNGEESLDYLGEEMGYISAYMAFTSRGNRFDIKVPVEGIAAYEQGKQFFYERRGQLNFACSSCHLQSAGGQLRAEILSTSLGQTTHWPTYRFKWEKVGGIHKRFVECNEQVGAEGLEQQSLVYRNLEYFMTYMNNGMELNGPATRK